MARSHRNAHGLRLLVTGSAGFVGSHLCERLLDDGHAVWGVDSFDAFYGPEEKRRNVAALAERSSMRLVEGDVRDEILLDGLFSSVPFDLVVHLAARPDGGRSVHQPGPCWDVNVTGTLHLLDAMRRHHVGRLVFASAADVYGRRTRDGGAFVEADPTHRPTSPFGASKRAGELLCQTWHDLWGLSVHCLRLFPVYGPRQRPDLRVGQFARRMRTGERIPITGDHTAHDYTYVDDVVECMVRSIAALVGLPAGEPEFRALNVGTGRAVTAGELAEALAAALGVRYRTTRCEPESGAQPLTLADPSAAERVLDFRARVALQDGLARTASWIETQPAAAEETAVHA